ncbi:hypothetical protein BDQ17DRAFT_1346799 [Cyathus striatus]|nr:hypothetical protein BDQ17DRAFT_1346799 [Cyathus striatus]
MLSYQQVLSPPGSVTPMPKQESMESSPPPSPPETYRHWDEILKSFLSAVGLTQTLRGFEADMLVLNPEFEKKKVQPALKGLMEKLTLHCQRRYVPPNTLPPTLCLTLFSQINRSISAFLADKRARNNASNRAEFLYSIEEKRKKILEESGIDLQIISLPIDRDTQMRYDIAKNEEGPLKRTMKMDEEGSPSQAKQPIERPVVAGAEPMDETVTASQYPAINERLGNVESHLALRYVPSTPRTLFSRLKFLEDHIIKLEKEYPPWAALHFNQPSRGWPPPPRQTPVIVPPHLRATDKDAPPSVPAQLSVVAQQPVPGTKETKKKSSLHKAVMEKLEVQQAMNELSGSGPGKT